MKPEVPHLRVQHILKPETSLQEREAPSFLRGLELQPPMKALEFGRLAFFAQEQPCLPVPFRPFLD